MPRPAGRGVSAHKKIPLQAGCTRTSEGRRARRRRTRAAAALDRTDNGVAGSAYLPRAPSEIVRVRRATFAPNCSEVAFRPPTAGSQHPPALWRWVRPYCPRQRISPMNLSSGSIPPRPSFPARAARALHKSHKPHRATRPSAPWRARSALAPWRARNGLAPDTLFRTSPSEESPSGRRAREAARKQPGDGDSEVRRVSRPKAPRGRTGGVAAVFAPTRESARPPPIVARRKPCPLPDAGLCPRNVSDG